MQAPDLVADYLNQNVDKSAVIETWERELNILTDLNYHFPDQSLLTSSHAATYLNGPLNYSLGKDYFSLVKPSYLVIGWYARLNRIYDENYVHDHFILIKEFGDSTSGYDVYKFSN